MLKAIYKQLPWMLALFVLGPIAGHLTAGLRAADGSGDATLLVGASPGMGVLAGVVTLAFAAAAGVFAARVNGCRSGLNSAGLVLAWAASQTATVKSILRLAEGPGPLVPLAAEGLVFCLAAAPVAAVIWQAGLGRGLHAAAHPLPDGSPALRAWLTRGQHGARGLRGEHEALAAALLRAVIRPAGLAAIGITVAVGAGVCWLVAQDTLKGQAIFAAAAAGVVAVPLGRLAGEALGEQPPMAAFFLGTALLALLGPLTAYGVHGGNVIPTLYSGDLIGVAAPVTLDWAAGAFLGIPIGEAWFVSMFRQHPAPAAASR
ncbi:MAG TPA: hypothetical protein VFF69_00395 [Phycisphaerales bacterium]|nr:hypothetical protein [Phycisphaerales bacterium]